MSERRITASKLPLLSRCTYWAREDVTLPPRTTSDDAERGNAIHSAAEQSALVYAGRLAGVVYDGVYTGPGFREQYEEWLVERGAPASNELLVEVAVAYDPTTDTGRVLETTGHRDYSQAAPHERVGTIDLAWVLDGCAYVVDLKTGDPKRVDHAGQNLQLHECALALARSADVSEAKVAIAFVDELGQVYCGPWHELDVFDLLDVADAVAKLVASVPGSQPKPGPHCIERHCPLAGACPAHVDAAASVVHALPELAPAAGDPTSLARLPMPGELVTTPQSPAHVARLLELAPMVEAWVEAAKRGVRSYVDEHGGVVELPDGRRYGKVEKRRETVTCTPEVVALLEADGLGAAIEVERSTSKAAIKRACIATAPKRQGTKKFEATLEVIGKAGALKEGGFVAYEMWPASAEKESA